MQVLLRILTLRGDTCFEEEEVDPEEEWVVLEDVEALVESFGIESMNTEEEEWLVMMKHEIVTFTHKTVHTMF